jgi:N-acetylneuraminic acid mutarotase
LQAARFGLVASSVNGIIYGLGGTLGPSSAALNTVEAYDPAADTWTYKAPLPTGGWKLTSSPVNGIIYAIGGGAGGNQCVLTGAVEAYDPATDSWRAKTAMPTARSGAATDVINGEIYVVGAPSSARRPTNSLRSLGSIRPDLRYVDDLGSYAEPRWDLVAASANGKLYAIGGWDPVSRNALDVVEEFNPGTNSWSTKSHMPTRCTGLTAMTINGRILCLWRHRSV